MTQKRNGMKERSANNDEINKIRQHLSRVEEQLRVKLKQEAEENRPLEEQKDALTKQLETLTRDQWLGRCFQDEIYDNSVNKTFLMVIAPYSEDRVWVLSFVIDQDPKQLDGLHLFNVPVSKISFEKEITLAAFKKALSIAQVDLRKIGIDLKLLLDKK